MLIDDMNRCRKHGALMRRITVPVDVAQAQYGSGAGGWARAADGTVPKKGWVEDRHSVPGTKDSRITREREIAVHGKQKK